MINYTYKITNRTSYPIRIFNKIFIEARGFIILDVIPEVISNYEKRNILSVKKIKKEKLVLKDKISTTETDVKTKTTTKNK